MKAIIRNCVELVRSDELAPHGSAEERLMKALGYDRPVSLELRSNRAAILTLACECEDIFQFSAPHAANIFMFGAIVNPNRFEAPEHLTANASGRGQAYSRAFEGCFGEAAEYLSLIERPDDPLIRSKPSDSSREFANTTSVHPKVGVLMASEDEESRLVQAASLSGKSPAWFAKEHILRSPEANILDVYKAESAGVGAGVSYEAAVAQGYLEIIERDAFALWWYGGNPAANVPIALINQIKDFSTKIGRHKANRPWWALDISTEFGIHTAVVLSSDNDGRSVICGASSGFSLFDALRDAFLEMCQMELGSAISLAKLNDNRKDRLSKQDLVWIERNQTLARSKYQQFQASAPPKQTDGGSEECTMDSSLALLNQRGFEAYCVDLTRENVGLPVARVMVPGLQNNPAYRGNTLSERLLSTGQKYGFDLENTVNGPAPL